MPATLPLAQKPSRPVVAAEGPRMPSEPVLNLKPLTRFKRAYTVRVPHTWRTRPDPLEGTYEYAKLVLLAQDYYYQCQR
jgi:hypothetical protein